MKRDSLPGRFRLFWPAAMLFALLIPHLLFAQNKTVSGTVKDNAGVPVANASVTVKGNPTLGTSTNDVGYFSLSVPEGGALVISAVSFGT